MFPGTHGCALQLFIKERHGLMLPWAFFIDKKIRKFSFGNFRLGKARSICYKSHSREAKPLNRPRKAWNW